MRVNNVKESEYVGLGLPKETCAIMDEAADLLVWENIDESPRVKKTTFQIVQPSHCGFYFNSPIICAFTKERNLTLSEVCRKFSNSV